MKNKFLKILAFVFVGVIALSTCSCLSRPITSTKQATESVGKVGEFDVAYEELYYLVHNYRKQLDYKYGEDKQSEQYLEELKALVYENITANYAILTLAKEQGLSLESDGIEDSVQASVEAQIADEFGGKRSKYKASIKENGLTDNYVRFSFGVDALYSRLVSAYLEEGIINDDEDFVKNYIEEEFARTWHIMMIDDGTEESRERAEEALALIESGKSMYDMIGSKYNEDFYLTTLDGYYFPRGTMDEAYEKAAFDLEIREISSIVSSVGRDSTGATVDCYYIIQRLEPEEAYIEKNFDSLRTQYHNAAVYGMVSELQKSLEFEPNAYGSSLDLLSLDAPRTVDYVVIVTVASVLVAVAVVAIVVLVLIRRIKKKNADILDGRTQREIRASSKK